MHTARKGEWGVGWGDANLGDHPAQISQEPESRNSELSNLTKFKITSIKRVM